MIDYSRISSIEDLHKYVGEEIKIVTNHTKVDNSDRRFKYISFVEELYVLSPDDFQTKLYTKLDHDGKIEYKIVIGGERYGYTYIVKHPVKATLYQIFKEGVDFLLQDQRPWISNLVHLHIAELNKIINTLIDLNYE